MISTNLDPSDFILLTYGNSKIITLKIIRYNALLTETQLTVYSSTYSFNMQIAFWAFISNVSTDVIGLFFIDGYLRHVLLRDLVVRFWRVRKVPISSWFCFLRKRHRRNMHLLIKNTRRFRTNFNISVQNRKKGAAFSFVISINSFEGKPSTLAVL